MVFFVYRGFSSLDRYFYIPDDGLYRMVAGTRLPYIIRVKMKVVR